MLLNLMLNTLRKLKVMERVIEKVKENIKIIIDYKKMKVI